MLTAALIQPSRVCAVVRRLWSVRINFSLRCLLLLLSLACATPPPSLSAASRQQHNVWYNGLMITGIAVDESSGDVFFSDAAGNRVIHQSANGSVIKVYDDCGFFSPMQLAYYKGRLYVADSSNNRVAVINVSSHSVSFSSSPPQLSSISALTLSSGTSNVIAVDGWGVAVMLWSPPPVDTWTNLVDLSQMAERPAYLSSVTIQPLQHFDGEVWLTDPTSLNLYDVHSSQPHFAFISPNVGPLVVQLYADKREVQHYILSQRAADEPMQVVLLDQAHRAIRHWTAPGKGGGAVPFHGAALYVDIERSMYVSDHGVDAQHSPYGRVVKLAENGTELGEWSMSDGTVHSFSSIWYDVAATPGESCAYWAADSEAGMVRVAAGGSVFPPFYDAPTDPADGRKARFVGIAQDTTILRHSNNSSFVLLDTSNPSTTKLWRFLPHIQSYLLINTSAAQLGPNIAGLAVDPANHWIYLSDTRTHRVLCLDISGELSSRFDTSAIGFVEPAGLYYYSKSAAAQSTLFVVDRAYNVAGAVVQLDLSGSVVHVFNDTTPPMWRPLSATVDSSYEQLYVSDSNGYVFQIDLSSQPYKQVAAHRPVPIATHIVSMTVNANSALHMVDAYSRRIIVLMWDTATWNPGNQCAPPPLPAASSSTATPPPSSTSASSSALWSAAVSLAVLGVVAAAGGATWLYLQWARSQARHGRAGSREASELLMAAAWQGKGEVELDAERDEEKRHAEAGQHPANSQLDAHLTHSAAATDKRYEYYVARYEVVAVVSEMEQLDDPRQQANRSTSAPLSIRIPQSTSPRASPTTATTQASASSGSSSCSSSSSSSTSTEDAAPAPSHSTSSVRTAPASTPASPLSAMSRPSRIPELQTSWRTTPTFIDTVTDLTILGEGSSGVVYRGMYRGVPCVVKLPKSVSLTGAAWREWQCQLCLPPHPNLVRFLGALPMSSSNYLVTAFVRQGSLHSLLASSKPSSASLWYTRPYGVMRCMRDMSAALHHIHTAGIVHRDVSCRNILVDSDGSMVLADLGLATQLSALDEAALQTAVPVRWTSPESLAASHYSSQSDVWSLGVALWEMTADGALPYGEQYRNRNECILLIIAGQLTLQVDERWGKEDNMSEAEQQLAHTVRELVRLCLTYDVEQRPDSEQLVAMVEQRWQEWQAEAGGEAERLEAEWVAYHATVQQRLGPPAEHTTVLSRQRTE